MKEQGEARSRARVEYLGVVMHPPACSKKPESWGIKLLPDCRGT